MSVSPTELRIFIYERLIERGVMPTSSDIGAHFGITDAEARDAIRETRLGKTLIRDPQTGEIWMAGPFAAKPTPYRVTAGPRTWWANCAWDMAGVASLVGEPVDAETRCTDCDEPMTLRIDPDADLEGDSIVHFVVPARQWYDDIGFT